MTIEAIRYELGDVSELPIMSDDELQYFLDKNNGNVKRTCLDVAKTMLFKLSMSGDDTVDIFSLRGTKAAQQFMLALQMYIKDPTMNPLISNAMPYAGGISKQDMQENADNPDNNYVKNPAEDALANPDSFFEV